jgi:molybdate transport system permease protein
MLIHLDDWFPIWLSLRVALISVTVIAITGLLLARLMQKCEFRGRNLVEAFITLSLVLPPSVVGYGLLVIIGKNGPVGRFLNNFNYTLVFTWVAVVIAATVVAFPLMYQSARGAFASVNPNFEKAARTLGAGEIKIFFTITLPLAWPGIMSGLVLSFARALGEFGATIGISNAFIRVD